VAAGCGVLLLGRMKDYAKDFLGFIYKTYFQPSRLLPKLKIWRELIYYEFAAPWVRPLVILGVIVLIVIRALYMEMYMIYSHRSVRFRVTDV